MRILAGAYSSRGGVRPHNEDAFLIADKRGGGGVEDTAAEFSGEASAPLLFLVADGMGGHAAGDVASAFLADALRDRAARLPGLLDQGAVEDLVGEIHRDLSRVGAERGTPNMGSTLTGVTLQNGPAGYFNAGDSRVYRLRNGFIRQITRDDSLSSVVPGAAKNIITNAVGAGLPEARTACRFSETLAIAGDVFLLCSDGVHGFVTDDDLEGMLALPLSPRDLAERIVKTAIANHSDDNGTAVVLRIIT